MGPDSAALILIRAAGTTVPSRNGRSMLSSASPAIPRFHPAAPARRFFFRYRVEDLVRLRPALGNAKYGRQFKRGTGKDHPPAIELYLSHRYFTTTEQRLDNAPDQIITVNATTLLWLLTDAGPAFVHADETINNKKASRDGSRSAAAFREGAGMRRGGKTFEQVVEALLADPKTADWAREKGQAAGGREFKRIWAKADLRDLDKFSLTEDSVALVFTQKFKD